MNDIAGPWRSTPAGRWGFLLGPKGQNRRWMLNRKYLGKNGGALGGDGASMLLGGARWVRYHHTKLANAAGPGAYCTPNPKPKKREHFKMISSAYTLY